MSQDALFGIVDGDERLFNLPPAIRKASSTPARTVDPGDIATRAAHDEWARVLGSIPEKYR